MSEPLCRSCGEAIVRDIPADDPSASRWGPGLAPYRLPAPTWALALVCDDCIERAENADEEDVVAHVEHDARVAGMARRAAARRAESGIPELLQCLELADPSRVEVWEAGVRWAAGESRGLLLAGDIGVGKTHMAAAAAWRWLEHRPLRWFSVPVLFAHLGLGFSNRLHEVAVETLVGTGALVLDDLDKVRPTEYAAEQVFTAIEQRVTAGTALLVTTNLDLDGLAKKFPDPFGVAIVDRLASYCESFYLAGQSRRRLGGPG